MVKWDRVCRSKNIGGLGVKDLRKQNLCLLSKWWWNLENHDALRQRIVKHKYIRNKTVIYVKGRSSDFPCWKALLKVKETYLNGRLVILNASNLIRFWLDHLVSDS
jgi:hypothetical protein